MEYATLGKSPPVHHLPVQLILAEPSVRRYETRLRGADETTSDEQAPCNGLTRTKS